MCTFRTEAAELELHVDNSPRLHRQCDAVFATLARRIARRTYDHDCAASAFLPLAGAAAASYCTAYAGGAHAAPTVFPMAARHKFGAAYVRRFEQAVQRGLYEDLGPDAAATLAAAESASIRGPELLN